MAGLNKELWLAIIREHFLPKNDFLAHGVNLDPFVENGVLHAAQAGVEPDVIKNPVAGDYPLAVTARTDTDLALALATYATKPQHIPSVEEVEINYNKRESVLQGHIRALQRALSNEGLWNIAPTADSTDTPVELTTGTGTVKKLLKTDLRTLARRLDDQDVPQEGRVLVLPPVMFWELVEDDPTLGQQMGMKNAVGDQRIPMNYHVAGFQVFNRSKTAYYNYTTKAKIAYGTSPGVNDTLAGVAYVKNYSFGRALGAEDIFLTEKSAEYQGDLISTQKRALILPFQQKAIGAIVQGK